jgi:hypothetical protein
VRRQKGIAAGGVAIVRSYAEHFTQRVQGKSLGHRPARKCTRIVQVQREIHRVEPAIAQLQIEVTLAGAIQRLDIVTNVVADNDSVAQVVGECQRSASMPQAASCAIPARLPKSCCR